VKSAYGTSDRRRDLPPRQRQLMDGELDPHRGCLCRSLDIPAKALHHEAAKALYQTEAVDMFRGPGRRVGLSAVAGPGPGSTPGREAVARVGRVESDGVERSHDADPIPGQPTAGGSPGPARPRPSRLGTKLLIGTQAKR
jgi:hypothetical protein